MDPIVNFIEALCNGHIEWQVFAGSVVAVMIILRIAHLIKDIEECLKK